MGRGPRRGRVGRTGLRLIFKILSIGEWAAAQADGVFVGSAIDLADGFIHFSAADQAVETARRHFAGRGDLVLLAIDATALGPALKWEVSRGAALFPHLYGTLPLSAVVWSREAPLGPDGVPRLGELEAESP